MTYLFAFFFLCYLPTLDNNVAVLSQGGTLHGEGLGGTGISGFKGVFVIVRHFTIKKTETRLVRTGHIYK
jgi:hypothetical protein